MTEYEPFDFNAVMTDVIYETVRVKCKEEGCDVQGWAWKHDVLQFELMTKVPGWFQCPEEKFWNEWIKNRGTHFGRAEKLIERCEDHSPTSWKNVTKKHPGFREFVEKAYEDKIVAAETEWMKDS